MTQWQPIETAPKNGEWILGFWNGTAIVACTYICRWSDGDGWLENYSEVSVTPTHWMHLPEAPK